MITSIWIRPGEDLEPAMNIRRKVFEQELGIAGHQDLLDPYGFHLVLVMGDVPVATGRITYAGVGKALLSRICVLKKYRRQGIGDGLVKVLDYKASQMGMKVSRVETVKDLEPFYMRIGYLATGETVNRFDRELIVMEKETNDGTRENCAHQCPCP